MYIFFGMVRFGTFSRLTAGTGLLWYMLLITLTLITETWTTTITGPGCENNSSLSLPTIQRIVAREQQNVTYTSSCPLTANFHPRWCIDGKNARNPTHWPDITITVSNESEGTVLKYINPSPSDAINGLTLYLVDMQESDDCDPSNAVSIQSDTGDIMAKLIVLDIIEEYTPPFAELQLIIASTGTTISYSHWYSTKETDNAFHPRWCIDGINAESNRLGGRFVKENKTQETILKFANPSQSDVVNGRTLYLTDLSEPCNIHKAVPIHSETGNITARWILLHIIEGATCSFLTTPSNGKLTFTNHSMGDEENSTTISIATYSCDSGFFLSGGNETRMCERDINEYRGEWSGTAPTCVPLTCSELNHLRNGSMQYRYNGSELLNVSENLEFGTMAIYNCDSGFGFSNGDWIRMCQHSGKSTVGVWSGIEPNCTAIECPSLSLTNGMITYAADTTPEFAIGTVATHSCAAGFSLIGDMTQTCIDDDQADNVGIWSGSAPSCELVRCSPLNGIKNGNVTYHESLSDTDTTDPLPYGSIATYMCDEHFNLTGGNQTRICGGNLTKGFWSGAAPTCNANDNPVEVIPEANVGVIAGGSISSLAVFSVILGLIGFMCGWKIRSSFTRRTGRESVMVQNLNTLGPTVPEQATYTCSSQRDEKGFGASIENATTCTQSDK